MATATLDIKLPSRERELLALLDRMPAHLPLAGKAAHQRLTGTQGTPHEQAVTASLLDQLTINGLLTRRAGYMGKPGKYYAITDRGVAALRA